MSVNRFASELYRRLRTFEDCFYPGPGGWVVRSVHDTFGSGTNCLIAAGSDRAGHQRAVSSLVEKIEAAWPAPVGFILDAHPSNRALESILELSSLVSYPQYGYRYLLTGAQEAFEFFREGCLVGEDEPQIHWKFFSHLRQLMLMPVWDLVEESGLMTDADRERIVNFFLRCYRSHEGAQWRGLLQEPGDLIGNHVSAAALNLHLAAHYFHLRYRLDETQDWFARARRHLAAHWRNPRSSADMAYTEFTGTTADLLTYALHTGADDVFVSGMVKKSAERAMLLCGNLGYATCEGECGFDQKLSSRNAMPYHFFGRAAALTGDGRYQWWARRPNPSGVAQGVQQRSSFFQTWDAGVEAVPPDDHIGMRWALADPTHFAAHHRTSDGAASLRDAGRALDKLAIRSGLAADDAYLAVNGLGPAGRGHKDAGAILWYEARGRVFLVDGGGLCAAEQFQHNSIVIIRDGQGADAAGYMTLEQSATLGPRGFVSLAAPDYNGCRWERSLFWRGDDRFLVLDRVTATTSGRFDVSSHWHVLGHSTRVADGVATTQAPRRLVERRDAALRIHCRPGSWRTELALHPGDYVFALRARPDYLEGHVGMRLRVDGVSQPDLHVTPGTRFGFGADGEPGLPTNAEVAFSVDRGGTHILELSTSVALGVDVLATSVRHASGASTDISLADWQTGIEMADRADSAGFRLAADQSDMQSLAPAAYMATDWRLYPVADPQIQAWVDRRTSRLEAGEDLSFAHLFGAAQNDPPQLSIRRTGQGTWSFTDDDTAGILLDHARPALSFFEGTRLLAEWKSDGGGAHFFGVSARRLGDSSALLSLSEAGAFSWQPDEGVLHLDLPAAARVWIGVEGSGAWRMNGTAITPSRCETDGHPGVILKLSGAQHVIEHPPLAVADTRLHELVTACGQHHRVVAEIRAPAQVRPTAGPKLQQAQHVADLGGPVTALAIGDTPAIAFVAGTGDGRVFVAGPDLQPVQRHSADGAIRCVAITEFGAGPVVLVGGDDAQFSAMGADGMLLFSRGFQWSARSNARYSRHCEVLAILVADLDGDEADEIYLGVNNQCIYKLLPNGSTIWEAFSGTAPPNILLPWIGNPRGLLIASSHPVSPSATVQLMNVNADEVVVSRYYVGSVWGARARKALVADVDNDGENEVVLATTSNLVRVFHGNVDQEEYPGDEPWTAAKWETWTGLPPVDILPAAGGGLWIATESGFVNRHDGAGKMTANIGTAELPLALLPVAGGDGVDLVTATGVHRISQTGESTPLITAPEAVVRAVDLHDGATTLLVGTAGNIFSCSRVGR